MVNPARKSGDAVQREPIVAVDVATDPPVVMVFADPLADYTVENVGLKFWKHHETVDSNPADGHLSVWRYLSVNADYIPVGAIGQFSSGIRIEVPVGVTVEVEGVPELERRRLKLQPRKFIGPCAVADIVLVVTNEEHASGRILMGERIATIRAIVSPLVVKWAPPC